MKNSSFLKVSIFFKTKIGRAFVFGLCIFLVVQSVAFLMFFLLPLILHLIVHGAMKIPDADTWFKLAKVGVGSGLVAFILFPMGEIIDEYVDRRKLRKAGENRVNEILKDDTKK